MTETEINELKQSVMNQIFNDLDSDNEIGKALTGIVANLVAISVSFAVDEAIKKLSENGSN